MIDLRRASVVGMVALAGAMTAVGGGVALGVGAAVAVGFAVVRSRDRMGGNWRWINGGALVLAVGGAVAGAPIRVVGAGLVAWLLIHRGATGRRPEDDRVVLLLSLLLVLLATIGSTSPWLGLLFAAWAFGAPIALALTHRGGGERGGLWPIGVASLALSAGFFLGLPRIQRAGLFEQTEDSAGFGDRVALGDAASLVENNQIVLRVKMDPSVGEGPFYLRGQSLDTFDGHTWTRTRQALRRYADTRLRPGAIRQEILQEPLPEPVLFGIAEIYRVEGLPDAVAVDPGGGLRATGGGPRLHYTVWSQPRIREDGYYAAVIDAAVAADWTALPADLDPGIAALAAELTRGAVSPWEQALVLETWLRRNASYVDEPDAQGDTLADFLLRTRAGNCEYFAAALAAMLRSQGVPARVVTGFLSHEWNDVGGYLVVRQTDAHAWVEVHLGGVGWVALDGTPAAADAPRERSWLAESVDNAAARWQYFILEYDLEEQAAAIAALVGDDDDSGGINGTALGVLVGVGALWAGLRLTLAFLAGERTIRRRTPLERLVLRTRARLVRRGFPIPEHLPPLSAARWLEAELGPPAAPFTALAWLLYRSRYGGEPERAVLAEARAAARALDGLRPATKADSGRAKPGL